MHEHLAKSYVLCPWHIKQLGTHNMLVCIPRTVSYINGDAPGGSPDLLGTQVMYGTMSAYVAAHAHARRVHVS